MPVIKDKSSLEWRQVKEFCETKLAELHIANEGPLSKVDTAGVRGQIELIREILDLENDTLKPDVPDTGYID